MGEKEGFDLFNVDFPARAMMDIQKFGMAKDLLKSKSPESKKMGEVLTRTGYYLVQKPGAESPLGYVRLWFPRSINGRLVSVFTEAAEMDSRTTRSIDMSDIVGIADFMERAEEEFKIFYMDISSTIKDGLFWEDFGTSVQLRTQTLVKELILKPWKTQNFKRMSTDGNIGGSYSHVPIFNLAHLNFMTSFPEAMPVAVSYRKIGDIKADGAGITIETGFAKYFKDQKSEKEVWSKQGDPATILFVYPVTPYLRTLKRCRLFPALKEELHIISMRSTSMDAREESMKKVGILGRLMASS